MTTPTGLPAAPEIDVEDLVIAYLTAQGFIPAAQISRKMPAQLTLPFVLVRRVAGGDDFITDHATIQIDSFNRGQDEYAAETAASDTARAIHHVMRQLRPKTPVTLPDGTIVTPYRPTGTEQTPLFLEYEASSGGGSVVARYVARYLINVRLPSIAAF